MGKGGREKGRRGGGAEWVREGEGEEVGRGEGGGKQVNRG